jgi:hypothetical protein
MEAAVVTTKKTAWMTRVQLINRLGELDACTESRHWLHGITERSAKQCWESCERADWLLWVAARANIDRNALVLAACACARTALKHVPKGEQRPLRAIETAEAWTRGEATIEQVRAARDEAWRYRAAADAAAAAAAAYAYAYAAADADAYADAYADAAADADAYAAAAAADAYAAAADAYAYAYAAAAWNAARLKAYKKMAPLVREHIKWADVERGLRSKGGAK